MADIKLEGRPSARRGLRRPGRRWREETVASAAALAALLNATACGGNRPAVPTTTTVPTTATRAPVTTAPIATRRVTTTTPATLPAATTTGYRCYTDAEGRMVCAIPGRPLRHRWRRMILLPSTDGDGGDDEARAEYASVASFGELALRLLSVGAPAELVAACHEAALDEIRHAALCDELAGRPSSAFGAIPGLAGRRLGGWRRSRRAEIRRLAVESFLDGWINEGAAASQLRERAARATADEDRDRLGSMAADEQRHAELARSIVTWCFGEQPRAVGRALARVAPEPVAA